MKKMLLFFSIFVISMSCMIFSVQAAERTDFGTFTVKPEDFPATWPLLESYVSSGEGLMVCLNGSGSFNGCIILNPRVESPATGTLFSRILMTGDTTILMRNSTVKIPSTPYVICAFFPPNALNPSTPPSFFIQNRWYNPTTHPFPFQLSSGVPVETYRPYPNGYIMKFVDETTGNTLIAGDSPDTTELVIKTGLQKTKFVAGDPLDLKGLTISLGSKIVSYSDFSQNGISTIPSQGVTLSTNDKAIKIYGDGFTTTYPIRVLDHAPIVSGISIKTPPTNANYFDGDSLDLSGLLVSLDWDDDSVTEIPFSDFAANNITVNPSNGSTLGLSDIDITVSCNGQSVSIPISVRSPVVSGITVKTPVLKSDYFEGDLLDLSGLSVTLQWDNGNLTDVPFGEFYSHNISVSPSHSTVLNLSNETITISCNGKSVSIPISVRSPVVSGITIKTPVLKSDYYEGDLLDLSGLSLTLQWDNGNLTDVPFGEFYSHNISVSPSHSTALSQSNETITISCNGFSVNQELSVTALTFINMELQSNPNNLDYTEDDPLDLSGLSVRLTRNNGTSIDIPFSKFGENAINTVPAHGEILSLGQSNITVSFGEYSLSIPIAVKRQNPSVGLAKLFDENLTEFANNVGSSIENILKIALVLFFFFISVFIIIRIIKNYVQLRR